MQASTIHPNMINEVMNCHRSELIPEVGMTATMYVGSDRYAMVVTKVITPKKIHVNHLFDMHEDKLIIGPTGIEYLPGELVKHYSSHPDYIVYTYRKNGRWMPQGQGCWGTCSIHLGEAENYRDPSF